MIDAKDLRIGNWINRLGKPTQINGLSKGYVSTFLSGSITENQIEPIPITHEILEKCGFEKLGENNIFQLANADIRLWGYPYTMQLYDYEDRWVDIIGTSIKYLHDLQNLYYALTKQELIYQP